MSFECPECLKPWSLRIVQWLELPPDSRSDEITLQILQCSACRFEAIAVYEESRRGALDQESIDHAGFRVGADDLAAIKAAIKKCPDPRNPRCRCSAHRKLGSKSPSGRWNGLGDIPLTERFAMKRQPRRTASSPSRRRPVKGRAAPGAARGSQEVGSEQIDRFLSRLSPPAHVAMLTVLGMGISAVLLFLPGVAESMLLDSLAFGITLCWIPVGIVWLVVSAIRARDNAGRAWGWLGTAVLVGLGVMLFMDMMRMRGEASGPRFLMFLICTPLTIPPLLPALYYLVKLWREVA